MVQTMGAQSMPATTGRSAMGGHSRRPLLVSSSSEAGSNIPFTPPRGAVCHNHRSLAARVLIAPLSVGDLAFGNVHYHNLST